MTDYLGQRFGNYELVGLLGKGGYAQVYLGEQIFLKTRAAIKVLDAPLEDEKIEQFRMEAGTIAHLDHPNIVRLFDFGVEHSIPYLVMSYAPNGTLRQRHPLGMPVPLPTVIRYVQQVAAALGYAHQQRVIHRDVKPENLLIGRRNEVLLSDFGIAVVAHRTTSMPTQDQAGTINYMAPEQLRKKPHPASDQYALAVLVYEWLTGRSPFEGSAIEIAMQHLKMPPPPLRQPGNGISAEVERVVLRAMEKHWQMRFASVEDFAAALQEAYSPRPPFVRTTGAPLSSVSPTPADLLDEISTATPPMPASAAAPARLLPDDIAAQETWRLHEQGNIPIAAHPAGGDSTDPSTRPPGARRLSDARRAQARFLNRRTALLALTAVLILALLSAGSLLIIKNPISAPASIGIGPGTTNPTQGTTPSPGTATPPAGKTTATPTAPGATPTQTPAASPTATTAPPNLSVNPPSLTFGLHIGCLGNKPQTLTIQNIGGGDLIWQAVVQPASDLALSQYNGSLALSQTTTISVTASCSITVSKTDTITFSWPGGSRSVPVTIALL